MKSSNGIEAARILSNRQIPSILLSLQLKLKIFTLFNAHLKELKSI